MKCAIGRQDREEPYLTLKLSMNLVKLCDCACEQCTERDSISVHVQQMRRARDSQAARVCNCKYLPRYVQGEDMASKYVGYK